MLVQLVDSTLSAGPVATCLALAITRRNGYGMSGVSDATLIAQCSSHCIQGSQQQLHVCAVLALALLETNLCHESDVWRPTLCECGETYAGFTAAELTMQLSQGLPHMCPMDLCVYGNRYVFADETPASSLIDTSVRIASIVSG